MALTPFNDNISVLAPKALDNKYGKFESLQWKPFDTLTEAKAAVVSAYRHIGLTQLVLKNGVPTEYWYRDGITDNDLIEKISPTINGTNNTGSTQTITNTGTGSALTTENNGSGATTSFKNKGAGVALLATSEAGAVAAIHAKKKGNASDKIAALTMERISASTATNGIGTGFNIAIQDDSGNAGTVAAVYSTLTDVTTLNKKSNLEVHLVHNNSTLEKKLSIESTGQVVLNSYGAGIFNNAAVYNLGVDNAGNVVEVTPSSGGSSYTFENGLTETSSVVTLGGLLTQNVSLNGAAAYRFDIFNLDQFSAQTSFAIGDNGDSSNSQAGLIQHGWNTNIWSGIFNNGSNTNIQSAFVNLSNDGLITGKAKFRTYINVASSYVSELYLDDTEFRMLATVIKMVGLPTYADNTAAASLATDTIYKTATGQLMIKY